MRLRVLDTGLRPARWNVAMSAALLAGVEDGMSATLRFHRYPRSCVMGRNQDAAVELDLAACRAAGMEVARRISGGGAVVMGPGVLAFDLVLPDRQAAPGDVPRLAGEALVRVLAAAGFAATRPTAGSVAIGGLKVSGSAGRLGRRAVLHQATLIEDLSRTAPLALLRRRTEAGRPTADPRHRVGDLASAPALPGRRAPRIEDVAEQLTRCLAQALGLEPVPDAPTAAEEADAAAILAREIGRDDYTFDDARLREEAA